MHTIKISSVTGAEIVTTADAKSYMRVDTSSDDSLIGDMIKQARIWCENYLSKDIVAKTRVYFVENIGERILLPFAPVSSITSVTAQDSTAEYKSYGVDKEILELQSLPAKDVKVTYATAGLSDELLKQAIMQLVSTYYDNRADFIVMQGVSYVQVPTSVKHILDSYKEPFI